MLVSVSPLDCKFPEGGDCVFLSIPGPQVPNKNRPQHGGREPASRPCVSQSAAFTGPQHHTRAFLIQPLKLLCSQKRVHLITAFGTCKAFTQGRWQAGGAGQTEDTGKGKCRFSRHGTGAFPTPSPSPGGLLCVSLC